MHNIRAKNIFFFIALAFFWQKQVVRHHNEPVPEFLFVRKAKYEVILAKIKCFF
jgi:hypothetical protein